MNSYVKLYSTGSFEACGCASRVKAKRVCKCYEIEQNYKTKQSRKQIFMNSEIECNQMMCKNISTMVFMLH